MDLMWFQPSNCSLLQLLSSYKCIVFVFYENPISRVKDLIVQGDFLNLLISEKTNVAWKSIIYGVPNGVMELALRSSTNTLATVVNLKRWKKIRSDTSKCGDFLPSPIIFGVIISMNILIQYHIFQNRLVKDNKKTYQFEKLNTQALLKDQLLRRIWRRRKNSSYTKHQNRIRIHFSIMLEEKDKY